MKRTQSVMVACLLLMAFTWCLSCLAAEPVSSVVRTRVSAVAVFKDGYGLYFREGRGRPLDGWVMLDYLPQAALGTVWIHSQGPKDQVEMVVSAKQTQIDFTDPEALERILRERIGSRVSFVTIEKQQLEGELTDLTDDLAILTRDGSLVAAKLDKVTQATLVDLPLRVKLAQADGEIDLGMTYLESGIRWLPSYTITLDDPKKAEMILRATIVNDAEELEDSDVHLVVGVPSFAYKGEVDPLALNRVGKAIDLRFDVSRMRNIAQVASEAARGPAQFGPEGLPERALPDLPGEELGELFMYELEGVSLKVGEIGMVTVFSDTVPYRTTYQWDADAGPDVWRLAELTNNSDRPWTTAPATFYNGWRAIGQNTLNYTAAKGEKQVKVNITRDIATKREQRELDRQEKALVRDGRTYAKVRVKGTLTLTNYKKTPAEVHVMRTVQGKVSETTGEATVVLAADHLTQLNPSTRLDWTLDFKPGETQSVEYAYDVYVR